MICFKTRKDPHLLTKLRYLSSISPYKHDVQSPFLDDNEDSSSRGIVDFGPPTLQLLRSQLQHCARNGLLEEGKAFHGRLIELGLQLSPDTLTSNILTNMYCKCGSLQYARKVFDEMPERTLISWNTMIGAYTQSGHASEGLALFTEMQKQRSSSSISEFTISSVLCACAAKCAVLECMQLHTFAIKTGVAACNVFVGTSLLDVYSKCNLIADAKSVFDSIETKSDVTWSSMVAGFVRNQLYEDALILYRRAHVLGVEQNKFTVSSALSACAELAGLIEGKQLHSVLRKVGLDSDVFVSSSLVDVYSKCGSIREAYCVFSSQKEKNIVLWNAIISGFSRHGASLEVMVLFQKMQQMGFWPNEVTYVSVLSACAHMGLVREGRRYFDLMVTEHSLSRSVLHYSCLVDLLGRSGLIQEAYDAVLTMPFKATPSIWGSLLASCKKFEKVEVAEIAAKNLFEMEPTNAGNHILLSDTYASNKKWGEAARSRQVLRDHQQLGEVVIKKEKGKSWIEIKGKVHTFMVGEKNHPQIMEIYSNLEEIMERMRELGYRVRTEHDFHDVEEREKEELLRHHGEKLAFVFGVMCLPPGAPVRIMKNLRICGDCHLFMKFASMVITDREIIVRDVNRFHHFVNGSCSCHDFW